MSKTNPKIILIVISIIICITELVLLINIFPQTGLARIIYVPFWIITYLFGSIWLSRITKSKSWKNILIIWFLIHIIIFHIMLLSWPQSSAIQKNLIVEFYSKI